jgi:transcriptional repressor NrdR
MRCPKCDCSEDKVIDSRSSKEGAIIRRRRVCTKCNHRFTTYEQIEHTRLMVVKRDGRREELSREKLLGGISKACQKRPISQQTIEDITQRVLDTVSEPPPSRSAPP